MSGVPTQEEIAAAHMNLLSFRSDASSRWAHGEIERLRADLAAAQARILELRDEVAILRLYGNKDCTSMADAVLAAMRKGEQNGK